MSTNGKKVLLVAVLVILAGTIVKYKSYFVTSSTKTGKIEQNPIAEEKRVYDLNSPPLTDADIYAAAQIASVEPFAEAEEDRDSAVVTSDNQALNNLNNTYATDF